MFYKQRGNMQFISIVYVLKMLNRTFTTQIQDNKYMMRILAVAIFLLLVVPGCDKDNRPLIPYVYVNLQLYPDTMDYIPVGGYIYKDNEGYRGLVIFRLLPNEFAVYERCCPYDPEVTGSRITVDASNTTCTCPVCGSKYILYDGSPYGGPSPYALMPYRWDYDGEVLRIYN
jgi:nitrite reductase/ring-hydroxylating ferredoxin subunit